MRYITKNRTKSNILNDELNYDDLLSADGEKTLAPDQVSMSDTTRDDTYTNPLDDDGLHGYGKDEPNESNSEPNSDPTSTEDEDVLTTFLKEYGIEDPTKMKFQNDNNELEDVDFRSLSKEDQIEVLRNLTDPGLSDQEKADLTWLRQNGMNLKQFSNVISQQSIQNYLNQHPEEAPKRVYQIDDYSDDELYLADLKSKYPDFTDEELLSKLETAKDNEDLYTKEVITLRNSYKEDEDNLRKQQEAQQIADTQAMQDNLLNAARNFNEVLLDSDDPESDSLIVEDTDKQQILSYLLDQDSQGKSQLIRDLEDPETLIQLAWLRLQGQNAISDTTRYWKDTLKEARKENAKLQKEIEKLKSKKDNSVVMPQSPATGGSAKKMSDLW